MPTRERSDLYIDKNVPRNRASVPALRHDNLWHPKWEIYDTTDSIKFKNVREKLGKYAYQVRFLGSDSRELQLQVEERLSTMLLLLPHLLEGNCRRRVAVVVDRRDKQEQDPCFEYQIGIQFGIPGHRAVFPVPLFYASLCNLESGCPYLRNIFASFFQSASEMLCTCFSFPLVVFASSFNVILRYIPSLVNAMKLFLPSSLCIGVSEVSILNIIPNL